MDRHILCLPNTNRVVMLAAIGFIASSSLFTTGCGNTRLSLRPRTVIDAADFASDDVPAISAPTARLLVRRTQDDTGAVAVITPGGPVLNASTAAATEQPVLIDAKVGDINGRPVYADAFLSVMEARLIAEAQDKSPAIWLRFARKLISDELERLIEDELLRAEALASFTPQQQQGLRYFVQNLRENIVRTNRGSETQANETLQREEGVSLDQYIKNQEARALVRHQIDNQILNKVHISWRDIQRFYEVNKDRYNPDPVAVLRRIRLRKPSEEDIARITDQLNQGVAFALVAADSKNLYNPEQGGMVPDVSFKDPYSDTEFQIGPVVTNDAAKTLTSGSWTGPLRWEALETPQADWIYLEQIKRISRPLDDQMVQLEIEQRLRNIFAERERVLYMRRLRNQATYTDVDQMSELLLRIAAERYYLPNASASDGS